MAGQTQGTAIAAREARRNEQLTLARGALVGERRAAVARLGMIVMFSAITELPLLRAGAPFNPPQFAVGFSYFVFAVATLVILRRIREVRVGESIVWPLLIMLADFSFLTALAGLDIAPLRLGNHAVACSVLILFAVARISVIHVIASVACALVSLVIVTATRGTFGPATAFVAGGYVVVGFMVGLTNIAVRSMFRDLRRRDTLTRFLPSQVAERMLAIGPEALAPVQREVTVLFSDIRGFTSLSESLQPREVLELLDDYFGRMAEVVKGHDGVVGKFMGDGMLAFWGAPDRVDDHARRAVRAARDMCRGLAEINRHRERQGLALLRIGIGIHTGTVAAGMVGGAMQAEYTVIGDAVNVASRIEGLTKQHDVEVLISETTWTQLGGEIEGQRLPASELRGRSEAVVLYALAG